MFYTHFIIIRIIFRSTRGFTNQNPAAFDTAGF